jgi:hypothetical protein
MAEYAFRTRQDGLPHDPWLRTHVGGGGVIEKVASASMVIGSSLAKWREWTGLPFDTEGPVDVPYALTPVHCAPSQCYAGVRRAERLGAALPVTAYAPTTWTAVAYHPRRKARMLQLC